ncbi:MAG: TldD/PmbA family protein [Proteobacteria bacterium]|nr:TldD/PmbA family protein [Pseudomonadota bacterium]MCP4916642.1 TldD/PmbA family protein [Pseudomonadota bacterium]
MPTFLAGCGNKDAGIEALATPAPENPFLSWFGIDESTIQRVLSELSKNGADLADVYFQHSKTSSIKMEDGIISSASTSIDQGVGLRCVIGDQTGYAFTEDLTLEAMLAAARTAAAIAKGAPVEVPAAFAATNNDSLYVTARPWADVGVDEKLPKITKLESLARGLDERIEKVTVSWWDQDERVLVATLSGLMFTDRRPQTRLWCSITANDGEQTVSGGANLAGRKGVEFFDDANLEKLAKQAVDRTTILFDAIRPPAGELPVVLAAGASGILLHEAIGHGLEADFNRKGTSIYSDLMGEQIAPEFVTIVDSGLEPGERGAIAFDDEGNETKSTVLVENGRLASYMHDEISAKHYGVEPTGSGRRQSFRHSPMPRMRCTFMEDGPNTRDEIIASVKGTGIIAETFTNGQVQIGAGDFTFYIKNGWLIEDGKVTAPIKDVNIIGNGPEALKKVTMAANDGALDTGGWTCGKNGQSVPVSQGLPTVLVSSMTVGGVDA